jgi:hypothetical protein
MGGLMAKWRAWRSPAGRRARKRARRDSWKESPVEYEERRAREGPRAHELWPGPEQYKPKR